MIYSRDFARELEKHYRVVQAIISIVGLKFLFCFYWSEMFWKLKKDFWTRTLFRSTMGAWPL